MPIDYDIDETQGLVVAKGSGVITPDEVVAHLDELAADSRYQPPMKKLIDYREVTNMRYTEDDTWAVARKKEHTDFFKDERCAFVSPGDATFATTRVHQTLANKTNDNTAVFRTYEEAVEWLGIAMDI